MTMIVNRYISPIFIFCLVFSACQALAAKTCNINLNKPKTVRIGFVTDGSTSGDKALVGLFKEQLKETLSPYYRPIFSKRWTLSGDDSTEGVRRALTRLQSATGPDIVVAIGVVAANEALGSRCLKKPVIAPFVSRFSTGRKVRGRNCKGRFVGIERVYEIDKDIDTFKEIVPFKKCVIILDKREASSGPRLSEQVEALGKRLGLHMSLVLVGSSPEDALSRLPQGVQAAFVGPLWHMDEAKKRQFFQGLLKKRIAGFSMWNTRQVELGLVAGLDSQDRHEVLARRVAIALLDLFHSASSVREDNQFVKSGELVVNMAAVRKLGVYPNLLLLTSARVINEKEEAGRRLNLASAVEEAVAANLRLQSARVNVKAGEHAVREKMAELLPRIDVGTGYRAVDQDRSKAGAGLTPERAWTGTAQGSVLLYSEKKWANYTAEEHLQKARQMSRERVRLDVTYDASVAYLNVLRARTIERIYKENLKLTKANLERAIIKVNTGAAGPDEVYRWQSKFANDRRAVLYRESDTMDAMEALNRILHRPLQERFVPEEARLKDPLFIMGDRFYLRLMDNPLLLRKFKTFAAKEAVAVRPELKSYDEAIRARARLAKGAKRELWLPDFTVEWKVDQYLAEDGHGRREGTSFDDTDWNIGVFARIPLFEGGKTAAKASRLEQEVSKLQIDRNAAAEAIIQNVLAAVNRTRASYPSIRLTREAALAAEKNLKLVTDSYIHGIKTIIDLLDAQNQYLNAKLEAANAVYNFLIDFMGVQRAMGEFVIFMPPDERAKWMERVRKAIGLQ